MAQGGYVARQGIASFGRVIVRRSRVVEIGLDLAAVGEIVDELRSVPGPAPCGSASHSVRLDGYPASGQIEQDFPRASIPWVPVGRQRLGDISWQHLCRKHHRV